MEKKVIKLKIDKMPYTINVACIMLILHNGNNAYILRIIESSSSSEETEWYTVLLLRVVLRPDEISQMHMQFDFC